MLTIIILALVPTAALSSFGCQEIACTVSLYSRRRIKESWGVKSKGSEEVMLLERRNYRSLKDSRRIAFPEAKGVQWMFRSFIGRSIC